MNMSKAKAGGVAAMAGSVVAGSALLYSASDHSALSRHRSRTQHSTSPVEGLVIVPRGLPTLGNPAVVRHSLAPKPVYPAGVVEYGSPGPINDELNTLSLRSL
jgi:hypothetical protein